MSYTKPGNDLDFLILNIKEQTMVNEKVNFVD